MQHFLLKRAASVILVLFTVLVVIFLLLHLGPGDPAALMAGPNANSQQIEDCASG